nr:MAG TPA: hypothetical protein [Caudoviricetes sp.]
MVFYYKFLPKIAFPFFNSSTCFFKSSISCLSSLMPSTATTPNIQ